MEAQVPLSLALRPLVKAALRQVFRKRKDPVPTTGPAPQAPLQKEEVAQAPKEEGVASQFHLFSDLPAELRLKIWSEATRYGRYVILDPVCNSRADLFRLVLNLAKYRAPGYDGDRQPVWRTRTPPPPMLSVNLEAREVALKTWKLAFDYDACPATVMKGIPRLGGGQEFMAGLKYLTNVKIGRKSPSDDFILYYRDTARAALKSASVFFIGDTELIKTWRTPFGVSSRAFVEVEVMDFVGGRSWDELIPSRWNLVPVESNMDTRVHFGPGGMCKKRARWRCVKGAKTDIAWAI
ncbi:hypothetical protein diail_12211 [Diaporthe ilicicola]|nr:hypothetical protein diail_12211 [Diaporthe ilicicola]